MCHYCVTRNSPNFRMALGEKGKFWPNGKVLGVGFIGGTASQRAAVQQHMPQWSEYANISFDFTATNPEIRISFDPGDGAWSYVGTDVASIPANRPTMNLGWVDEAVILHETGHTLGLGHEHQNPEGGIKWNVNAVIKELSGPPNNWDVATIMWNVIEAYNFDQIIGTTLDRSSIMMYSIPFSWTLDGFSTSFNNKLSELDKLFIQSIYPFPTEEQPNEVMDAFRRIFLKEKDIRKLTEDVIVRLGKEIGADANASKFRRVKNAEIVWNKLKA